MSKIKSAWLAGLAVLLGPVAAHAVPIDVSGAVTNATGAFASLTPIGTPVSGPVEIDALAFASGSAGIADIDRVDINVGGFCFSSGAVANCPLGGAFVPVTSFDAVALTFMLGVVGGMLDVTAFSPTFQISIPIHLDFGAGTFSASAPGLGTVNGTIGGTYEFRAVPEPGTLALLGLGLAGIGFAKRKTA